RRIDMPGADENGIFRCQLEEGEYRLITVNRLPNGHMYAFAYLFTITAGDEVKIPLQKRHVDLAETLSHNAIVDFDLQPVKGQKAKVSTLLEKRKNILVWIEEGKEPTEHILNEMMEQEEDFRNLDGDIIFMLRSENAVKQATLAKALAKIPNIRLVYDDFTENVNTLGRRMYVDPEKLPLVIVMVDGLCGVYASSGYNVGLADILVRIIKAL
ncbi:MAG: transglutaminase, partial [Firmicutes bacterium]|nr:transglutaminase [Bacillota bacterium]